MPLFAGGSSTGPAGGATIPIGCAAVRRGFSCGPEIIHLEFKIIFHNIFQKKKKKREIKEAPYNNNNNDFTTTR
jgi:hypothetical protein